MQDTRNFQASGESESTHEFEVDGEIHMKRKKNICLITMLILVLSMLSAYGNKMTTNKFNNEAILGIEIKKIEAYLDKLVVTFADDSLSEIEKVEIDYYGTDNAVTTETPDFSFQKDVLTIETNHADEVSEMRIWDKDRDLYFYVRYIYSDSYAMLVYSWADDAGYLVNGDEDAFYTEEEKEAQEELEAVWIMRRAMGNLGPQEATERIVDQMAHTKNNEDFIQIMKKIGLEDKNGFK